jgi:hypothetical protein
MIKVDPAVADPRGDLFLRTHAALDVPSVAPGQQHCFNVSLSTDPGDTVAYDEARGNQFPDEVYVAGPNGNFSGSSVLCVFDD